MSSKGIAKPWPTNSPTRCCCTDQITFHLRRALENGLTRDELIEAITHLAFYAGWPKAMSAMAIAKQVFRAGTD